MSAFVFPTIEDGCDCRPCSRRRGVRAAISDGYVESYSSTPLGGWRQPADDLTAVPTFGVELETSLAELPYGVRRSTERRFTAFQAVDRREAASLAAPSEHWLPKSDCSVTGPEFASQPASLDWWNTNRPVIGQFLKELRHGGCGTEGAGLHVNIGTRASFGGPEHLARFATLCTSNPRFFTRMAGRTHDNVQHWAKFDVIANPTDWGQEVWAGEAWSSQRDRYSVVNGQARGRVEFRLPAGTLDVVQFYAMLEWVASMVEFTRENRTPNVSNYVAWLRGTGSYGTAIARMTELFPSRFESPAHTVAVTTHNAPSAPRSSGTHVARESAPEGGLCENVRTEGTDYVCELPAGHEQPHAAPSVHVEWFDPQHADGSYGEVGVLCLNESGDGSWVCTRGPRGHAGYHEAVGFDAVWGGAFGTLPITHAQMNEPMPAGWCSAPYPDPVYEGQSICGYDASHSIHTFGSGNVRYHEFQR